MMKKVLYVLFITSYKFISFFIKKNNENNKQKQKSNYLISFDGNTVFNE